MESYPLSILYCPICTFPVEYCKYSGKFTQCKVWIAQNCPEYYPELSEEFEKIRNGEAPVQEEEKRPKKVKVAEPKKVVLAPMSRGGKKTVVGVSGLKLFNINLKDAAKNFRKALSCGCSVVEDTIEIQGNLVNDIRDLLLNTYPDITEDLVQVKDQTTKKKRKN